MKRALWDNSQHKAWTTLKSILVMVLIRGLGGTEVVLTNRARLDYGQRHRMFSMCLLATELSGTAGRQETFEGPFWPVDQGSALLGCPGVVY